MYLNLTKQKDNFIAQKIFLRFKGNIIYKVTVQLIKISVKLIIKLKGESFNFKEWVLD